MGFTAAGRTVAFEDRTTAAGASKIAWVQPSVLNIASDSEQVEFQGVPFEPGVVQNLASATISQTVTGSISFQKIGEQELEVLTNVLAEDNGGIELPSAFQESVTSNAITVTGLTADQKVIVTPVTTGARTQLTQVTGAPSSAGEYQVTTDTITFNSGDFPDGTFMVGVYFVTNSVGRIIGGNSSGTSYGTISFYGQLLNTEYSNPINLYIKSMTLDSTFDIGLIGSSGDDVSKSFTASTPTGWNSSFAFLLPTS